MQRNTQQRRGNDRRRTQAPRVKPEFEQKILNIRRVARVVAGGKRFTFAVAIVVGNRNGKVGVGTGKAGDTSSAIEKSARDARKHIMLVSRTESGSIRHEVKAKYSSATLMIRPAPGRGLVAGSAVRNVLDLAGIRDVNAKILSSSKNKLNIARATIAALQQLENR